MIALVLNKPGKPDTLTLSQLPVPRPDEGEIRVRVHAVGLNPVDYKVAANGHPAWVYPFVLGLDVAGTVDEVGAGVTKWAIGDRVVYHGSLAKSGGYAAYSITTAHTVAAIPEGISYVDAAAFPCAGLTAYQAIQRKMNMHLRAGQSILIHGGAGGVGGYAIQLARIYGASKIITTASSSSFDFVKGLGANICIDYNNEDVHQRVMDATAGQGVDLILNTINRATAQKDLSMLAFGGQLTCIAGAPENIADFQPANKTITLHRTSLGGAHGSGNLQAEEDLARMAEEFMQLMLERKIESMVKEVIQLADVPVALTRMAERHVQGKIVVKL
jgi:NADPH2:quinone reductase